MTSKNGTYLLNRGNDAGKAESREGKLTNIGESARADSRD